MLTEEQIKDYLKAHIHRLEESLVDLKEEPRTYREEISKYTRDVRTLKMVLKFLDAPDDVKLGWLNRNVYSNEVGETKNDSQNRVKT